MKYNAIVRQRLDDLQKRITETKLLNDDVNLVMEVMPSAHIWLDNEVNVTWAATNMSEVKELLAKFAKRHTMLKVFIKSDSSPVWYLKGLNTSIRLCPCWSLEGSAACRLIKVGEDTCITPKYKLVCDEGKVEETDDPAA